MLLQNIEKLCNNTKRFKQTKAKLFSYRIPPSYFYKYQCRSQLLLLKNNRFGFIKTLLKFF